MVALGTWTCRPISACLEAGNVWQRRGEASFGSLRHDASVFLGMDTLLGPVYMASGFDDQGQQRVLSVPGADVLAAGGTRRASGFARSARAGT